MQKVLKETIKLRNSVSEAFKIAYYPGCSLDSTAIDFNISIKKLLKFWELGLMK